MKFPGDYRDQNFCNYNMMPKDQDYVNKRWSEYLEYEKKILQNLEIRGDRMH